MPGVFLRRPLSIYATKDDNIEFLYRVVGTGTENLSKLEKGDKIDVLGPLGNDYDTSMFSKAASPLFDKEGVRGSSPVLIAGGTGIASLSFLADKLKRPGILFFGAKNKANIIGIENFKRRKWNIKIATEDGSKGHKGYITDLFASTDFKNKNIILYCCGPSPMLKKMAELAAKYNYSGYASLEEMMACGTGICQGCAVKAGGTYKMVCKDGPVFDMKDVEW